MLVFPFAKKDGVFVCLFVWFQSERKREKDWDGERNSSNQNDCNGYNATVTVGFIKF